MSEQKEMLKAKVLGKPLYKRLSLNQKVRIIEAHEKGVKNKDLAREFNVVHGTITGIIANKEKYLSDYQKIKSVNGNVNATRALIVDSSFEKAIYTWFVQKINLGEPVSGPLLKEKARELYEKVTGKPNFKASEGWLSNFKARHGFPCLNIVGEHLSAIASDADGFRDWFNNFISERNFNTDNIYNADEAGLFWKPLPERQEMSAPGREVNKKRVTILACANATGTDRIPLLIIGNSKKPRCFKNKHMPVIYESQKNAWMDRDIFMKWYKDVFLVHINKRKPDKNERFILLLDNAPSHPPLDELNEIDPRCVIVYLPAYVISILQPMDQGCILALKKEYKCAFLRELLAKKCPNMASVALFVKTWSLYECCTLLANCWVNLSEFMLKDSWKNLICSEIVNNQNITGVSLMVSNPLVLLNKLPDANLYSQEVEEWITEDWSVPTFRPMNDDEILEFVVTNRIPEEVSLVGEDNSDEDDDIKPVEPCTSLHKLYESLQYLCSWSKTETQLSPEECQAFEKAKNLVLDRITQE